MHISLVHISLTLDIYHGLRRGVINQIDELIDISSSYNSLGNLKLFLIILIVITYATNLNSHTKIVIIFNVEQYWLKNQLYNDLSQINFVNFAIFYMNFSLQMYIYILHNHAYIFSSSYKFWEISI